MNDNQHFGNYLKVLLQKYNIKHSDLAETLSVSRQYVSSIITNRKTPSRDCFDAILTFLDEYLTPSEKQNLANKLIYAKTGINNSTKQFVNTDITAITVGEQILLEDFRKLNPMTKTAVIRFVRQKEIELLIDVAKGTKKRNMK